MKTILQQALLILTIIFFILFILEFIPINNKHPKSILTESFDSSLRRLNTQEKITKYCDSVFSVKLNAHTGSDQDSLFADIAAVLIRKRFYHDWAEYGIGNNYMALFLQPFMYKKSITPIVDIEDILNSPAAICGQQARVLAAILETKKISVRKVLFDHPVYGGHYAIEAFYQGSWHFFDVDKEPNLTLLRPQNRPSLSFLQSNPDILTKFYNHEDPEMITAIFKTAKTENFLKVEGPNLLLFQKSTKILSYTMWLVFLVLYLLVKNKNAHKRDNTIQN